MSDLYKKHNYLNKNIDFIICDEIMEYDMVSAGFNICKEFELLPKELLIELGSLPKEVRNKRIGILQLRDKTKTLSKAMNEGFIEARRRFFEANLIKDEEVISIKKDAIFVTRRCRELNFGYIEFGLKNNYTSYYYINKIEFYFNNKNGIDVKGINDSHIIHHKEYMMSFLHKLFYMNETSTAKSTIKMLNDFILKYKRRELPLGYYRELNQMSLYQVVDILDKSELCMDYVSEEERDKLNIKYNFFNYLVPIIQILL